MKLEELLAPEALDIDQPYDPWMQASLELEQSAQQLDLEPWIVERLRHCDSELSCNIPLRKDDGEAQTCRAVRVRYSNLFEGRCGELQISAEAYVNCLRASAARNTWSAALFDLHLSGCSTALICDPAKFTEHELHNLVNEYANSAAAPALDETMVPGIGTNEYVFGWLARAENSGTRLQIADAAHEIAPVGIVHAIKQLVRAQTSLPLRIAIQGFGVTERRLAEELVSEGASIVAVSDHSGGIIDSPGLDIASVFAHVEREQMVFGYPQAEPISNADLLETSCDVLVLSGSERQLTPYNAPHISTSLVVECAPDAVTAAAEEILHERQIPILPFAFVNGLRLAAGQHSTALQCGSPAFVRRAHAAILLAAARALGEMNDVAHERKLSLRAAAQTIAFERIAQIMRLRGYGI